MSSLGSASYKDILGEFKDFSEYKDKLSNINEIQIEIKVWNKLKSKNSSEAYKQYLKEYPNGIYINEAKKLCIIAEDSETWQKAQKQDTKEAYEKYLTSFKDGVHTKEAQEKIEYFINDEKAQKEIEKRRKVLKKLINWANINNIDKEKIPRDVNKLMKLKELNLHGCKLNDLPNEIGELQNIHSLYLSYNYFKKVPKVIEKLENLDWIVINTTNISELPEFFKKYKNLEGLYFQYTQVKELPDWIGNFKKLEFLGLNDLLVEIPETFYNLNLYELTNLNTKLVSSKIENFKTLRHLEIFGETFPKFLGNLNLTTLRINFENKQKEFPEFIKNLQNLEKLKFVGEIQALPVWIKDLKNLQELDISLGYITETIDMDSLPSSLNKSSYEDINKHNINITERDNSQWLNAIDWNKIENYKYYLNKFPNGIHKKEALEAIKAIEEEDKLYHIAKQLDKIDLYKEYLDKYPYPKGKYAKNVLEKKIAPIILKWFEVNGLESERLYKKFSFFYEWDLRYFDLNHIKNIDILTIPEEIKYFKMITSFELWKIPVQSIPDWIGELDNLEKLDLKNLNISSLPNSIKNLKNLKKIRICDCNFKEIPKKIDELDNLEEFEFRCEESEINILPEALGNLKELRVMNLYDSTNLEVFPNWLGDLSKLEEFFFVLSDEYIKNLPESFKNLKELKSFPFAYDKFPEISTWVKGGYFPNLERIFFSGNTTELPNEIIKLTKLKSISAKRCSIVEIPEWINKLTNLESISIFSNTLRLPSSIGDLEKLTELYDVPLF